MVELGLPKIDTRLENKLNFTCMLFEDKDWYQNINQSGLLQEFKEARASMEATKVQDSARYLQLVKELEGLTDAEQDQINMKRLEMESLENNINQYNMLESQIRQTTGAYKAWQDAQNTSESGDMFTDT